MAKIPKGKEHLYMSKATKNRLSAEKRGEEEREKKAKKPLFKKPVKII